MSWLLVLSLVARTSSIRFGNSSFGATARSAEADPAIPPLVCTMGEAPFSYSALEALLPEFVRIYDRRLHAEQVGGTLLFHQFYLFAAIKTLKPTHLIESGAFQGLGTWMLRQSCPECQITVVSPDTPQVYRDQHTDSVYFTGANFKDFNQIDWAKQNLDMSKTLIFFDDHQAGLRRLVEAKARGFKYAVLDDNYVVGDNFSPKDACDPEGKLRSKVVWLDNFGQINLPLSKTEAMEKFTQLKSTVKTYYEMPPLWTAAASISPGARQMEISGILSQGTQGIQNLQEAYGARTKKPLLSEEKGKQLIGTMTQSVDFLRESSSYTYFPFVELK